MVSVVCFDLGGVLVRICRNWLEASEKAGFGARHTAALRAAAARAQHEPSVDAYQRGAISCEQYQAQMSKVFEGLYSPAEVGRVHASWTLEEYPGVGELVDELNRLEGLTTACLSNTNHAHWQRLSGAENPGEYSVVSKLEHQLASHQLKTSKPDGQIYKQATSAFGCPPEEILFFDDLSANVQAARNMGWRSEQVDHTADTCSQMRRWLREHRAL